MLNQNEGGRHTPFFTHYRYIHASIVSGTDFIQNLYARAAAGATGAITAAAVCGG